uniref:Uncharacterized protein n=1 Tax=Ditylenchus dipsaci TaxID=166011 RepID=A0A915DNN0_9BILA
MDGIIPVIRAMEVLFSRMEARMDARFNEVDAHLGQVQSRIDEALVWERESPAQKSRHLFISIAFNWTSGLRVKGAVFSSSVSP